MESIIGNSSNGSKHQHDVIYLSIAQTEVLAWIDLTASVLSLIGAATIIVSIVLRGRLRDSGLQPLLNLSFADAIASAFFISCSIGYLGFDDESAFSDTVCLILTTFTGTSYISTMLLSSYYALEVYLRLRMAKDGIQVSSQATCTNKIRMASYITSWLLPFLTAIGFLTMAILNWKVDTSPDTLPLYPVIPVDHDCSLCLLVFHYRHDICWDFRTDVMAMYHAANFLFILIILIVLFNLGLYILIIRLVNRVHLTNGVIGYQQWSQQRQVRNRVIMYQTAFIVCWLPAAIVAILSITPAYKNMRRLFPLFVIQSLTSTMQGVLNAVVYGWNRRRFMTMLRKTSPVSLLCCRSQTSTYNAIS